MYIRPTQDDSTGYFPQNQKLSDKISDNWDMQLLHRGEFKALYTQNNSGNDENLQAFRGYLRRIRNALLQRNKKDTNKTPPCDPTPKIQNKYILYIFLNYAWLKNIKKYWREFKYVTNKQWYYIASLKYSNKHITLTI